MTAMIDDIERILDGCIRKAEQAAVAQCYRDVGKAQLAVKDVLESLNRAAAEVRLLRFAGDEAED